MPFLAFMLSAGVVLALSWCPQYGSMMVPLWKDPPDSCISPRMKFTVDKRKAVEAIVYVASRMPGIGRFHASKALYFAEFEHLRNYGRPVFGDRYIAMDNGPVPSFAYDALKGTLGPDDRVLVEGALSVEAQGTYPKYKAAREPNLTLLSRSDIECLDKAIDHVKGRSFGSISDETHEHTGWKKANLNAPIAVDDMLEGVSPEIVESAEEFAAYGIL
ncbi:Panacea domain-containing protein [Mesorhizobium jarvisii]|uniref:Panacea domain-containing protein n=1 Tax=Mesorhizobium jarvisii TaxID=1777867 RepID=UPI001F0AC2FD|nr:Panacea domain-containing protein [Mesorhizobium jarvisii]MCH4560322.1 SocA family protein [Mesorhizobium jarvisii]